MFIWSSMRCRYDLKIVVNTPWRRSREDEVLDKMYSTPRSYMQCWSVGHKCRWLKIIILKIINYNYDLIIPTLRGLPTNGLITVYVYCHYLALPCIKIMQIIVFSNLEAFYKKSYSSPCREEFKRGANDLAMIQVVSHRPVTMEAWVSPLGHFVCDLWRTK